MVQGAKLYFAIRWIQTETKFWYARTSARYSVMKMWKITKNRDLFDIDFSKFLRAQRAHSKNFFRNEFSEQFKILNSKNYLKNWVLNLKKNWSLVYSKYT